MPATCDWMASTALLQCKDTRGIRCATSPTIHSMQYNILICTYEWYIQYLVSWSDLVIWIWTENEAFNRNMHVAHHPLDKRHILTSLQHFYSNKFARQQCSDLVLCLLTRVKPAEVGGDAALSTLNGMRDVRPGNDPGDQIQPCLHLEKPIQSRYLQNKVPHRPSQITPSEASLRVCIACFHLVSRHNKPLL